MRRFIVTIIGLAGFAVAIFAVWAMFRALGGMSTPKNEEAPPIILPEPLSYATKPEIGYLAPNFSLKTLDGQTVRLADFLGRVVVVNFSATWCPFCITQYPALARLAALAPRDIVVITINRGQTPAAVAAFIKTMPTHPNLITLLDTDDQIYGLYQAATMPYFVFIDRDGVIRAIGGREMTLPELNDFVLPLRQSVPACWQEGKGKTC